jgi:lantibiotic modifying enzyme
MLEEIEIGLHTTFAHGFSGGHSLCHGSLGNIEAFLSAWQVLRDPRYHVQLEQLTALVLDSIETRGYLMGTPHGVETPGLMVGLAGIGYELLRLAEPDKVPSLLVMAPPLIKRIPYYHSSRFSVT